MLPFPFQRLFPRNDRDLFRNAVWASLFLHFAIFGSFYLKDLILPSFERELVEIDLTKPFRIGGNPLLKPGGGTTDKPIKVPSVPGKTPEGPTVEKSKAKDWILPGPNTPVEPPTPEAAPPVSHPRGVEGAMGEGYQGSGGGFGGGHGEGGGLPLDRYPQLINKEEILRLLRKNYPRAERIAGREGTVYIDFHLDAGGKIVRYELAGSAGESFDQVVFQIIPKMKFSPAIMNAAPIGAKIRSPFHFKIEEDE